jgi:hypothetical protein
MNNLLSSEIPLAACLLAASIILRADPTDEESGPSRRCSDVRELACGNGMVVQVGPGGGVQTSKAGRIRVERLGVRTFVRSVTFGQRLFVAVGGSYIDVPGAILTSRDGVNWVRRNAANRMNLHQVAWGSGLFVAAGDSGTILISTNGVAWMAQRSGTSASLTGVAYGNGLFVAGGESGTILTSTNGVNWISGRLKSAVYVGKIFFRDGHFLFGNSDAQFTSADGLVWQRDERQGKSIENGSREKPLAVGFGSHK